MKLHRTLGTAALALLLATPAWSQGTLFVEGDNVGIGTPTPEVRLHIDNTGGDSNVARLVRDGVLRYRLENTNLGIAWDFNNTGAGDFAISQVGTGKAEFAVTGAGQAGIGCNSPDHDLVISTGPSCAETPRSWVDAGSTSFSTSSSRSIKENLEPIGAAGIIDKLQSIPVYEYDFVDGPKDRIGLVAEDFHQVFRRGSDKELSGHEVTMALWLAVQELSARVEELQATHGPGEACNEGAGS